MSTWSQHLHQARADGRVRWDLTGSNPTRAGLRHPDAVYETLGAASNARYQPDALGDAAARRAVARYYGDAIDPQRVWICASTSEAYAHALTLLCDPGDAVAVPRPGYPLLDTLADISGVRRVDYPVRYDGAWHVDLDALQRRLEAPEGARVRAVVSVCPNNPTGHILTAPERDGIEALANAQGAAHVVDEAFADYPPGTPAKSLAAVARGRRLVTTAGLSLTMSGLSKVAALPQMKLSWMVVGGLDEARVAAFVERARVLADAFLSVATPVQRALPQLLAAAEPMQLRIRARLRDNLATLRAAASGQAWDVLPVDAGWTAVLRLPQGVARDDEAWAAAMLDAGVATSPGFLADAPPSPPLLAVSLLTPPNDWRPGVDALAAAIDALVAGA